jgi:hypothetical protein
MFENQSTEVEEEKEPGLFCFLSAERECGPDCMAFKREAPEGIDYRTPDGEPRQWAQCMLLVHAHKLSKHVVALAVKAEESVKLQKNAIADQMRASAAPPAGHAAVTGQPSVGVVR